MMSHCVKSFYIKIMHKHSRQYVWSLWTSVIKITPKIFWFCFLNMGIFSPWFQYTLPGDFSRTHPSHFHAQAVRSLQSSDFQAETILSPRRHMAKNKNSFYCHLVSAEVLLPASSEQRPGILLNTLHCTVQAPTTKNHQPKRSIVENCLE